MEQRKADLEHPHKMIYLTPMPVRIWHWLNALGIVTLTVTGIQIRFPEYVNVFGTYKSAISLHNTAGIVVALSYFLWLFYYVFVVGSLAKLYIPTLEDIKHGLFRQAFYYFFLYFFGKPNPHHSTPDNKFNPLQKTAYLAIMLVLLPLVIVTGIFLLNVAPLRGVIILIGGLKLLVGAHFLIACCFTAFLFVHIYLATLGHTPFAHFVPMWTGWEEEEEEGGEEKPKIAASPGHDHAAGGAGHEAAAKSAAMTCKGA
ncbi:cytochrome b/b6 domain-containing protein [Geomesophilobacter sediminis]|uniref:Cytochrome b/b6 domain-containing protein n=1 Tax=Geomesophilobacter sediminis TaxID=2798584 RepID=A0A8J7IWJ6_9BACT|nr:cytochrome b/b6 domain-containing protein [Geomesophilobacter sediminis]MBJ6723902.1 cytochrome b/b6 domain-containing protein [Geomesophilobacter sediminis]